LKQKNEKEDKFKFSILASVYAVVVHLSSRI